MMNMDPRQIRDCEHAAKMAIRQLADDLTNRHRETIDRGSSGEDPKIRVIDISPVVEEISSATSSIENKKSTICDLLKDTTRNYFVDGDVSHPECEERIKNSLQRTAEFAASINENFHDVQRRDALLLWDAPNTGRCCQFMSLNKIGKSFGDNAPGLRWKGWKETDNSTHLVLFGSIDDVYRYADESFVPFERQSLSSFSASDEFNYVLYVQAVCQEQNSDWLNNDDFYGIPGPAVRDIFYGKVRRASTTVPVMGAPGQRWDVRSFRTFNCDGPTTIVCKEDFTLKTSHHGGAPHDYGDCTGDFHKRFWDVSNVSNSPVEDGEMMSAKRTAELFAGFQVDKKGSLQ
jgi:hypothetical protein